MPSESNYSLKAIKFAAIAVAAVAASGIATVMFLARGTGEDITGIVAPALLLTFASTIVAVVASVMQVYGQNGRK